MNRILVFASMLLLGIAGDTYACQIAPCPGMGGSRGRSRPRPAPSPVQLESLNCKLSKPGAAIFLEIPTKDGANVYTEDRLSYGGEEFNFGADVTVEERQMSLSFTIDNQTHGDIHSDFSCALPIDSRVSIACEEEIRNDGRKMFDFSCEPKYRN